MLEKVKANLTVDADYPDSAILGNMLATKQYMINAGVTIEQVESDLGIVTLTVGTNDLWNIDPGKVKFSPAFDILLAQLMVVSLPDV